MHSSVAEEHLADGDIVQVMDGVAAEPTNSHAGAHLAQCDVCTARLRQLRRRSERLGHLLREADWVVPPTPLRDEVSVRRARRAPPGALRAAAVVLLLVGAGAIASPLRAWVANWASEGWVWLAGEEARPATEGPGTIAVEPPSRPRVRFVPADGVFTVHFDEAHAGGTVELGLSRSDFATVEQVGGAAAAALLVIPHESRVRVRGGTADPADYLVRVPDGTREVRIQVGVRPARVVSRTQVASGERVRLGG